MTISVLSDMHSRKPRNFLGKIRLNIVSQVQKHNITSASCIPHETISNRFLGSKMIRKNTQSIKESIAQVCLQLIKKSIFSLRVD